MSLVPINEVVTFDFRVHTPSTGALVDADSTPTFDVFMETTDTPILAAQVATKRTGLTGKYRGTFTASAANGFVTGKWYTVDATAIVGGVSDSAVVAWFRVAPIELEAGVPLGRLTPSGVDDIYDEVASGHTTVGSFGDKFRAHQGAVLKVLIGSSSTTTSVVLNASTGMEGGVPSATNDFYTGAALIFLTGTLAGQRTSVSGYTGSTKTLTVVALTSAPSNGDLAVLV